MRVLHSADWHLGRVFHGRSLLAEQAKVLDELCLLAERNQVDGLIIAGDVFDRAVPPVAAVELLDSTLTRLVGMGLRVLMTAGNHDSARRLSYGARLLRQVTVVSQFSAEPAWTFEDSPWEVYALPHLEAGAARELWGPGFGVDADHDMRRAVAELRESRLSKVPRARPSGRRAILVAHCHVAGARAGASERSVAGWGQGQLVSEGCFFPPGALQKSAQTRDEESFEYLALGHIHRPQSLAGGRLRYSGSIAAYSFAEEDDVKSVSLLELPDDGAPLRVTELALPQSKKLRTLSGRFEELMDRSALDEARDDFLRVRLEDRRPVLDALARLRERYPNLLVLEQGSASNLELAPAGLSPERRQGRGSIFNGLSLSQLGDPGPRLAGELATRPEGQGGVEPDLEGAAEHEAQFAPETLALAQDEGWQQRAGAELRMAREASLEQLFSGFYRSLTGRDLSQASRGLLHEALLAQQSSRDRAEKN